MRPRLTRTAQQQQTRERLLDAAVELFSRRGYHAASVDEIGEAAGFSKGAVYSNFASKEELFLALLDRHFAKEVASWRTNEIGYAPPGAGEGGERPTFLEVIRRDKMWNLLLLEFLLYALREESVRTQVAERMNALNQQLGQHLAQLLAAKGVTPPLPLDHLGWVVNALGTGLSLLVYLDPEHFPADLYERALDHLLGLSSPGS